MGHSSAEYNREWANANKEKMRASRKKWRLANPKSVRAAITRHNHAKRAAEGIYTAKDIAVIRDKQKDKCLYCPAVLNGIGTIDHKHPISRGGTNWPNNLALACKSCNSSKGALTPIEFRMRTWEQYGAH